MFRALKWAYERGVQHERMRIKKIIAETAPPLRDEFTNLQVRYRDETNEQKQQRLKQQLDLNRAVDARLQGLLWQQSNVYPEPKGYSPIDDEAPKQ